MPINTRTNIYWQEATNISETMPKTDHKQSSKKTIVFHSHFLENSGNFLNFTKISNKFGEFSRFFFIFFKFS